MEVYNWQEKHGENPSPAGISSRTCKHVSLPISLIK